MSLTEAQCSTVYLTDYNANSDKFYRAYVVGSWTVFQWGARGTVGQFKAEQHGSQGVASAVAADKLSKKISTGYGFLTAGTFQFDEALLDGSKPRCVQLDDVRQAAGVGTTPPPPPAEPGNEIWDPQPQAAPDLLGDFTARALNGISLAVSDPAKGAEEFALLNASWQEVEQQISKARSYLNTLESLVIGVTA